MQLSSTGQPLKLTWDAVVKQFENLVKFAASQQVRNYGTDNVTSVEDLYQEGMIKLYDCWEIWCVGKNKDMDEFKPIFTKSLFRCMRKGMTKKPTFIDIEDTVNTLEDKSTEDIVERMYREESLQHLHDNLSSNISQALLQELIEPSIRTQYEVWADIERKKMIKSQGKKVNIPKDNTIRMKHIIRALNITSKQYDVAIAEIRETARLLLER